MKKIATCLFAFMLALSFMLAKAPQTTFASDGGTWVLPLAGPTTSFTLVNVDEAAKTAPVWLQKFSDGIQINAPTKICFPFRGGAFHWVPEILQLNDGKWSKVDTTKEYLSGTEGDMFACAAPKQAGTFALFGYYNGPVERPSSSGKSFTVNHWTGDFEARGSGYDVTNLIAHKVNWNGYYPTATKLAWGVRMCWGSECREYPDGTLTINSTGFPYPQNRDVTIIDTSTWYIYPATGDEVCEFKPFVELLDASDHVLDVIYYTDYSDYCVS